MKRKISDKDLDVILEATAQQNSGKHGSAEQMLEDLRNHFAEEKAKKSTFWKKVKSPKAVPIWITSFALIIAIAIVVPIIIEQNRPDPFFNLEQLRSESMTYTELETKVGTRFIPLEIDGYTALEALLFYNPNNTFAGYKIYFKNAEEDRILLRVIFNQKYIADIDFKFSEDTPKFYLHEVEISVIKDASNSISKFVYLDNLFYIEIIPDAPSLLDSVLEKIII